MFLNHKKLTQLITLLSLMGLLGSLFFSFFGVFQDASTRPVDPDAQSKEAPKQPAQSGEAPKQPVQTGDAAKQLKLQELGYMEVLKREPKNQTALQGLIQIRLASKDFKGALTPLDTLIQLHPDEESLKQLRGQILQESKK